MKKLYGTKGCAKCALLKKNLENNNEEFEYFDIVDMTKEEIADVVAKAGSLELPFVVEE